MLKLQSLCNRRVRQVVYRVWYMIRNRIAPPKRHPGVDCQVVSIKETIVPFLSKNGMFETPSTFTFLNIRHEFYGSVDWDYPAFGKLWTYNLNYFDFLSDEKLNLSNGLALMDDFMARIKSLKNANEPYPISLRIFSWLKFLQRHEVEDVRYARFVASDLELLSKQPEYHLMGNHLLENGFALYFGGTMLGLPRYRLLGQHILKRELKEQILNDGAHFELSPMYHIILLERLLDCLNVAFRTEDDEVFLEFMRRKAELMVRWLCSFSFSDESFAMVNDSAHGGSVSVPEVVEYANALGIHKSKWNHLIGSGYRKFSSGDFEMLVDVGSIGPDYIPGHAHSDTLSFVLHHSGKPIFVDTGTSTYEANAIRQRERSTAAHNTVVIDGKEQSEVWGAFRVGRRAKAEIIVEFESDITASHSGYHRIGAHHQRSFSVDSSIVTIQDEVPCGREICAHFHLHPDVKIEQLDVAKFQIGALLVSFGGQRLIEQQEYEYAAGFNRRVKAHKLIVWFDQSLKTEIRE